MMRPNLATDAIPTMREVREEGGFSIGEFAKLLGCSIPTLRSMETGGKPRKKFLNKAYRLTGGR